MANREQPSCVDMQTCGQLTLSQMPASIKLQMILFRHFPAYLQIVKAVIAILLHFMGCIAGIRNSNAYRESEVSCVAKWI